jgi:hypothetical protein
MRKRIVAIATSLTLGACAASPDDIAPQYVSPMAYSSYTCQQIHSEMMRVRTRAAEVAGRQRRESTNDKLAMGAGLLGFWPALFLLANTNDRREELARLRGEYEALHQAGTLKTCFAMPEEAIQAPAQGDAAAANPPTSQSPRSRE